MFFKQTDLSLHFLVIQILKLPEKLVAVATRDQVVDANLKEWSNHK